MTELLDLRAAEAPQKLAFAFRPDAGGELRLSYGGLQQAARGLAAGLAGRVASGERAILLFPSGLEFIVAWFACQYAGVIAAPLAPPRRLASRDHSLAILADCQPRILLAPSSLQASLRSETLEHCDRERIEILSPDRLASERPAPPTDRTGDVAFLQYTSGSTGQPKGVVVRHANLLANLEMIRRAMGNSARSVYAGWGPMHHDLGLIMNVLEPLYLGSHAVLMSPAAFVKRPLAWLRAISDHQAEVAGGPNFAYDLCVERARPELLEGLDLSSWQVAFNGAEPVRAETLDRFAATFAPHGFQRRALYPCYGLAEATLMVSGGSRGDGYAAELDGRVACGRAVTDAEIAIVDPQTHLRLAHDREGEIWIRGPHVAGRYWNNPRETRAVFAAHLQGEPGQDWLRTGDLGRLNATGELTVTGRLKDLIIVRGANHYPQDIEATVQAVSPALRRGHGAAFVAADGTGHERLVIVQELERTALRVTDPERLIGDIREAVANEHELSAHRVLLVRPGALPITTSGKVRRAEAKRLWAAGGFAPREPQP